MSNMSRPPFECRRCNQCCYGEGGIYLERHQVAAAAAELGMGEAEFVAAYLRERDGRYEVVCKDDGACALLGPQGCRIHRVKPERCRQWPFFPEILERPQALAEAKELCPGIDPEVSHQDFVAYARRLGLYG